jgi:predicted ATPase
MSSITRFEIKKLHGDKNIDLKLVDNTLILVGENGAGKSTVLQLFYYLLSGQWSSMAKYQFESVGMTIENKKYILRYSDIEKSLRNIDRRVLGRLPPSIRNRVFALLEQTEGRLVTPELERICEQFGVPLHYLLHELDLFDPSSSKKAEPLREALKGIRQSLKAQLLYLPTYRRIEQELSLIFKGLDDRELRNRGKMLSDQRKEDTFVELIEFGMKDVEEAVNETRKELDRFARESLNNLTFSYLGDVVEHKYTTVDLKKIKSATPETVENILNRIQEPILSSANKQHLREIIEGVKADGEQNEHAQVICHYFTKLMAFHEELEAKEAKIVIFCKICNDYMVGKEFKYDTSNFQFSIRPKDSDSVSNEIKLHHLSSGEKQIVSLFSHLYLSGGKKYFVLIDEPELSLSVPWQRKFLLDIRKADFCTGLVAVTHSPFIYDNELKKYAHGLGEFIL